MRCKTESTRPACENGLGAYFALRFSYEIAQPSVVLGKLFTNRGFSISPQKCLNTELSESGFLLQLAPHMLNPFFLRRAGMNTATAHVFRIVNGSSNRDEFFVCQVHASKEKEDTE